jgi:LCP family protein required for cell wall assembly
MNSTGKLWIWIAIVALIGIALLMVACETGVLLPQDQQQSTVTQQQKTASGKPAAFGQGNQQFNTQPGEKSANLTEGKPYSAKLVEEGTKNVLIIGEDSTSDKYDTIGVASIDRKNKTLKVIMIPRDTYIEYNQDIIAALEEKKLAHAAGIYKINCAHGVGSIIKYRGKFDNSGPVSFLAEVITEKFGIPVDDYVKINTNGFRALINHLGGVDIYVPYLMNYNDPTQDLSIYIKKGQKHLNGSDAEGFVRFRQGYREDGTFFEIGDPGRKNNQLNFIKALINQKGTLGNIGKIPGMIDIMGKNVQHSIGFGDILQTYMGLARYIVADKYEITSENLNSEKSIRIDGSSYMVLD